MELQEPIPVYNRKNSTIEEYLQMEEASDVKHEYYQGEIFAMSGPKVQHNNCFWKYMCHFITN